MSSSKSTVASCLGELRLNSRPAALKIRPAMCPSSVEYSRSKSFKCPTSMKIPALFNCSTMGISGRSIRSKTSLRRLILCSSANMSPRAFSKSFVFAWYKISSSAGFVMSEFKSHSAMETSLRARSGTACGAPAVFAACDGRASARPMRALSARNSYSSHRAVILSVYSLSCQRRFGSANAIGTSARIEASSLENMASAFPFLRSSVVRALTPLSFNNAGFDSSTRYISSKEKSMAGNCAASEW